MYYVSQREDDFELSRKVKRLSDFQGVDGKEYVVRKKVNIKRFDKFPVYICRAGKLYKTKSSVIGGMFNF